MNETTLKRRTTIERTYTASLNDLWDMWTTKEGIESWWGPEGFSTVVQAIDLRPGGEQRYSMTATGEAQVEFMKNAGMPLTTEVRITYLEVVPFERLAYTQLADFVPGVEPYAVATQVEFHQTGNEVRMKLTFDAMHNEEWTQRAIMGHEGQLQKLDKVISRLGHGEPTRSSC